jgi:hypothetical protein
MDGEAPQQRVPHQQGTPKGGGAAVPLLGMPAELPASPAIRTPRAASPGARTPRTTRRGSVDKGAASGISNFVLRNRLFLLLLTVTSLASLFVSFYVDIKILNMFDDPALAMTTTLLRPAPSSKPISSGGPMSGIKVPGKQRPPMDIGLLKKMLNITRPPQVVVEGDFDSHAGIAIANNNMMASLASEPLPGNDKDLPFEILYEQLDYVAITEVQPRPNAHVTIRSGTWLPMMIPGLIPSKGWFTKGLFLRDDDTLLVYQLPWEFTMIPKRWVNVLARCVDRVWVPSLFVRDAYVDSGLPAEMVDVVPHAINDSMWSPANRPFKFPTKKKFTFLFVSGMLHRKGIDVLLQAFTKAFTAEDDVSLYLHTSYSGESKDGVRMKLQILADIQAHLLKEGAPEIVLDSDQKLSEDDYFGL